MTAKPSFWDLYFRAPLLQVNGVELPRRSIINMITDQTGPTDDPANERTNVPINGIMAPGGAVGSVQVHALDGPTAILAGATNLNVDGDGNLVHTGKAIHKEDWSDFRFGSGTSLARSQWSEAATSDATPTTIAVISFPAAAYGDCGIDVYAKTSYCHNTSGTKFGTFAKEASFQRSSGTLALIGTADFTPTGLAVGTAPGGLGFSVHDNDTIWVVGTGIASKAIAWFTSLHMQLLVRPS